MKNENNNLNETPADAKSVFGAVFSPWDFAENAFSETLNYMTDEELDEIDDFDNENDLREYLQQFFERT